MPGSSIAERLRGLALAALACLPVALAPEGASAVETDAPRALIVETDTGTQLYAKAVDRPFAPGNFAKLMTAAVVYDAIEKGEIRDDTMFRVSEHAWRTGGAPARVTTMFAPVKSEIAVENLLRGLVVQYANDAAIALAEGLSGSEAAFAERMNALAAEVGLAGSRFANPTGYADPAARTTVADVARLVDWIRTRHPQRYALYALPEFEWNKILQRNKTDLVNSMPGVEGLMLAFDEADGFAAAISQVRDGRRVLVVASGFPRARERESEVTDLLDAAFGEFTRVTLFRADEPIGTVRVFGGVAPRVPVAGASPVAVTLPREGRDEFRIAIVYDGPVEAPVARGDRVAALEVREGARVYQTVPLVAAEDVPVGDMRQRALDGLWELVFGWW